jgi:HEPN domain-containing protein
MTSMISRTTLQKLARARADDAAVLIKGGRYDGAVYLYGYVVELRLKARICRTLNWPGFPETHKEFESYKSLKTHDLDVLLALSGREAAVKAKNMTEWSIVAAWDPEIRYRPAGAVTPADAVAMGQAVAVLVKALA